MRLEEAIGLSVDYELRPRYAETDQMGFVYYSNYLVWFECARTEWLRRTGKTYAELEAQGLFLPVKRCEIDYVEPARYDRRLIVRARVAKLTAARVEFSYEVLDAEDDRLLARGATRHAFIDADGRVSRRGLEALGVRR